MTFARSFRILIGWMPAVSRPPDDRGRKPPGMTRRLQRRPASLAATSSRIPPARLAAVSLVVILAGTAATWSATSGNPITRIVTAPNPRPAATYGPAGEDQDAGSGHHRTPEGKLKP